MELPLHESFFENKRSSFPASSNLEPAPFSTSPVPVCPETWFQWPTRPVIISALFYFSFLFRDAESLFFILSDNLGRTFNAVPPLEFINPPALEAAFSA